MKASSDWWVDSKNREPNVAGQIQKMVAEIDEAELAVRLIEIGCKMKRPEGKTGKDALAEFRHAADQGLVPAYIVDDFEAMAAAAVQYLAEQFSNATPVN